MKHADLVRGKKMPEGVTRRSFLHQFGLGITAGHAVVYSILSRQGFAQADSASRQPNIVFIMADDMGFGDVGCYNPESKIPTPNMDRLASEGIRFTDAHSPSAVCSPTRYGVLTGRYAWRTYLKKGVLYGESPLLINTDRMTTASLLKQHGYATACIGKWHLGFGNRFPVDYHQPLRPGPNDLGFDYFYGLPGSLGMAPNCFVENDHKAGNLY